MIIIFSVTLFRRDPLFLCALMFFCIARLPPSFSLVFQFDWGTFAPSIFLPVKASRKTCALSHWCAFYLLKTTEIDTTIAFVIFYLYISDVNFFTDP